MGCSSSSPLSGVAPDVYFYAKSGDAENLRKAILKDKDKSGFEYVDEDGLTALAVAATAGNHECLKLLLSVKGINFQIIYFEFCPN